MNRPPRIVALSALAIGAFQLVGSIGAAHNQPERRDLDVLAVVLVVLGPAALAWRARWPALAAAAAIAAADLWVAIGYPYGPIFLAAVVGLVHAVQAGHRRAAWSLAGAGYAGFVVAMAVDPRGDGPHLMHLSVVAGWLAVVLAIGELVRVRRSQAFERRRADAELRQRRIGEQRLALAQELHDVLAHNISLINVQASVALHLLDEQPDRARPALASIKEASHQALQELRVALDALRRGEGAPRAPAPRLEGLDELVAGVRASGLDVHLTRTGDVTSLPAPVQLAAYRIVQEALTNVTRHAGATSVRVEVSVSGELAIEVVDDGRGAPVGAGAPAREGNGLIGMRERAESLGGSVTAGSLPAGGFRVHASIPLGPRP